MRAIVLGLAAVLLCGCYESSNMLLDQTAAAQPVKTAQDWSYTSDGTKYHARLLPRADGWYDFREAEVNSDGSEDTPEQHTVLLNLLNRSNGNDVYMLGTWNESETAYMYGLAIVRPDGTWKIIMPNCDRFSARGDWAETDLQAALKAGGTTPFGQYGCFFSNRTALRIAMRNLEDSKGFWDRVAAKD